MNDKVKVEVKADAGKGWNYYTVATEDMVSSFSPTKADGPYYLVERLSTLESQRDELMEIVKSLKADICNDITDKTHESWRLEDLIKKIEADL